MTLSNPDDLSSPSLSQNYSTGLVAPKVKPESGEVDATSIRFSIPPERVLVSLGVWICVLLTLSTAGQLARFLVFDNKRLNNLFALFYVDNEVNIPTAYSSLALLLCAALLGIIAVFKTRRSDRFSLHWKGLSGIFVLLSLDEMAQIHELAVRPVRNTFDVGGLLYFAWIIPAIAIVAAIAFLYFKFLKALPARTKFLTLLAGALYVGGAIVVEAFGGNYVETYGVDNLPYVMFATLEEACEMFGVALFIYALLDYIRSQFQSFQVSWDLTRSRSS